MEESKETARRKLIICLTLRENTCWWISCEEAGSCFCSVAHYTPTCKVQKSEIWGKKINIGMSKDCVKVPEYKRYRGCQGQAHRNINLGKRTTLCILFRSIKLAKELLRTQQWGQGQACLQFTEIMLQHGQGTRTQTGKSFLHKQIQCKHWHSEGIEGKQN